MSSKYKEILDSMSLAMEDASEIVKGLASIAEDTQLREMSFNRDKICTFIYTLKNLSEFLHSQAESAQEAARQAG